MDILTKFKHSPISIDEIKLNFFAPVEKIPNKNKYSFKTKIFETKELEIIIRGVRLTQIHRDILDIILFYGDSSIENQIKENVPVRKFSLYQILKALGHKDPTANTEWIKNKIDDLTNTTITMKNKIIEEELSFHIVRVAKYSKILDSYILVIEDLYLKFFENTISINYKELLPEILKLKNAVTKMTIRYLLTHSNGVNINIDKLLKKIGVIGGKRNLEKQRAKLLEELKEIGKIFNIELKKTSNDNRKKNDYTIIYKKHDKVQIYFPSQKTTD